MLSRKAPKMINLEIEETSGVDHPAHLHEGWLVVKASNATTVADVLRTLPESMEASMSEATEENVEQEKGMHEEEEKMDYEAKGVEEELAMAMARVAELEARISELEGMVEVEIEPEEKIEGEEMMEAAVVALAKSASSDVRKALVDMAKAKAQAENALVKEREDRADAEAILKARETFKHLNLDVEKVAPALRRLDAELAKSIEDALISADAQNESADIFTEVGKGFAPQGEAIDRMTSLAKAAVAEGKAATFEQALSNVALANPALYNDYLIEKGA
jgi:vacuolar-type H+-ATPase subunit I/STV1